MISRRRFWRETTSAQSPRPCGISDLFGEGNYYIELQDHGLEEDTIVLPQLISLARETGIPMAATNDSLPSAKVSAKMQSILLSHPDRQDHSGR